MKILFIHSVKDSSNFEKPILSQIFIQFGISYISSLLKKHNHNTDLLVLTDNKKRNTLLDLKIKDFSPAVICFTAVATEFSFICDAAGYIKKKYPHIFLLIGGPHVSLNPEPAMENAFDAVCIGEGEYATLELVEQLAQGNSPCNIENLWLKCGKKIEKTPTRSFDQNIDNLPFPDRKMWQDWIEDPDSMQTIILGRGCPFQCTYCCNHALKKIAPGKYIRFRSVNNVIEELETILREFPETKEIYFEIETITVNIKLALELCSQLKIITERYDHLLSFGVNVRYSSGVDYEQLFKAFQSANFSFVNIGLESGCERVRREVLKRYYSNEEIIQITKLARKFGMEVVLPVMVGIPGETLEDFEETIKCVKACQPVTHGLEIFYPYPGTEIYQLCRDMGVIKNQPDPKYERRIARLDLPGFSKKQIQEQYDNFEQSIKV
jgi:anaerobic magnesium-protoporphyrin IX monomethyl ester cyclase